MSRYRKVRVVQIEVACRRHPAGHTLLMAGDDHFVLLAGAMLRVQLPFDITTYVVKSVDAEEWVDEMPF